MLITALLSGGWQRLLLRTTNHLWQFPDLSNTKSPKITCKVQHVSEAIQTQSSRITEAFSVIYLQELFISSPALSPTGPSFWQEAPQESLWVCFLNQKPREGVEMSHLWGGKMEGEVGLCFRLHRKLHRLRDWTNPEQWFNRCVMNSALSLTALKNDLHKYLCN